MFNELTHEELSLLEEVVKEYISELRTEIAGTEHYDFRKRLKEKEEKLQSILTKFVRPHLVTTV
jgi:hypothetical protein